MDKPRDTFDDDFGFSTVDTNEITDYNEHHVNELTEQVADLTARLDRMYTSINKLLTNLSKNPEQELIKWPNRAQKIKEFKLKLNKIRTGEE